MSYYQEGHIKSLVNGWSTKSTPNIDYNHLLDLSDKKTGLQSLSTGLQKHSSDLSGGSDKSGPTEF
jgi:hypothetical protein